MTDLDSLTPYFDDNVINTDIDYSQIDLLYNIYLEDFSNNKLIINDKLIRINKNLSNVNEFKKYHSTFHHIITRNSHLLYTRVYDCHRANRIHWIKPILLNKNHKDILYYKWKDSDGVCKEHFYYLSKNFMVVLKTISEDFQIVTAFCVDDEDKFKFFERYRNYIDGIAVC